MTQCHSEHVPSAREWDKLSSVTERQRMFARDLYFRECWAEVCGVFGDRGAELLSSVAMLSMKPDAIVGRRSRAALEFLLEHGFVPRLTLSARLTRHSMRDIWRYDWHVYPVDRLAFSTLWYTSTDILVFLLDDVRPDGDVPATVRLSQLKGNAVAEKRRPGELRTVLEPPNRILNFVHAADEPADIVRELGILFDRPERLALLRSLSRPAESHARERALEAIAAIEARHPAHDLDVEQALVRLSASGALSSHALATIRNARATGEKHTWDVICALVDPTHPRVDRWDFICVASSLLYYELEAPDMLPPVDLAKWRTQG